MTSVQSGGQADILGLISACPPPSGHMSSRVLTGCVFPSVTHQVSVVIRPTLSLKKAPDPAPYDIPLPCT